MEEMELTKGGYRIFPGGEHKHEWVKKRSPYRKKNENLSLREGPRRPPPLNPHLVVDSGNSMTSVHFDDVTQSRAFFW